MPIITMTTSFKPTLTICDLLALQKPSHWPRSSFYNVRSALRSLADKIAPDQTLRLADLPRILDEHLFDPTSSIQSTMTRKTYRNRILKFAAEYICGEPFQHSQAKRFFERLSKTPIK
jgi:hypothetical protein